MMYNDEVITEVRRVREELAEEYQYNVQAMMQAFREKEGKDGRKVVRLEPKRVANEKKDV